MSKDVILKTTLLEMFPDRSVSDCLSLPDTREQFVIFEFEQEDGYRRTIIEERLDEKQNAFHIFNPTTKAIHFLALDGCFFPDPDMRRCDCLLFDDFVVCFVELKLDVTTYRKKTRTSQLRSAREQLGITIQFFKDQVISLTENFFDFELEAYVVMQTNVYPRSRAGKEMRRVAFLEEYGVKLYEENEKTF